MSSFSPELIKMIKHHEGLFLNVYQDTRGYDTIGFGHTLTADEIDDNAFSGGISEEAAQKLLQNDLTPIVTEMLESAPWIENLDPVRRDCLYDMAFNLGASGLLKFKLALGQAQAREHRAAAEMKSSRWCAQVGPRCKELSKQMETGNYVLPND
ncbi:MAG: glycoside hydrolase family protein [Nitrospirae bacterium]|nr:glycoside hydrolase family protein [Nitrospirota bacterium]